LFKSHDYTKKIVGESESSNGEDGTYRKVGDLDLTKTEGFGYVNLKCIILKMKSLLPELKYVFLNPAGNYKKKWLVEHYKKLGFRSIVCSPDISYPDEMAVCDDKGGRGDLMMFADYEILKSNLETKVSSGKHNMSRCDNIRKTGGKKKKTKRRYSKRRYSKRG